MKKPSERIKELQNSDYKLDYAHVRLDALIDYLDEEWEKNQKCTCGASYIRYDSARIQ